MPIDIHIIFALIVLCWAAWFWFMRAHRTVLLGFSMMAVLTFLTTQLSTFTVTYIFGLDWNWITSSHVEVYYYTTIGVMAMILGLTLAWRPIRKGQVLHDPFAEKPALVPFFMIVGFVIMFFSALLPQIATISGILYRLHALIQVGFLGALAIFLLNRDWPKFGFALAVFIPSSFAHMVLSGHVLLLGTFLLQPVIVYCFWRPAGLARHLLFFVLLGLYFIGGTAWINTRDIIRGGEADGSVVRRLDTFLPQLASFVFSGEATRPEAIQFACLQRLDNSGFTAAQAAWMPEFEPYSWGESLFIDPIKAAIPRFLWREKTITLGDNEFINRYTGARFEQDKISVDTNIIFEFYANFGAIGVVAGLFFFGWIAGWLELRLFRGKVKPSELIPICIMLITLAGGGRRAAAMMLEMGSGAVAGFLLGKWMETLPGFRGVRFRGSVLGPVPAGQFIPFIEKAPPPMMPPGPDGLPLSPLGLQPAGPGSVPERSSTILRPGMIRGR